MAPRKTFLVFALGLALGLAVLELYARHAVRATPAGQALARYRPDGRVHAVFLGSSLTDAGIRADILDSLLAPAGIRSFNLALAGLSGGENHWLLLRGFILPRSRPRYLVAEAPGIPFLPPVEGFRLEGNGLRVETFRAEYLDWPGFLHLAGGLPSPAQALSFLLHKGWATFRLRHELQARLREKLFPPAPESPRPVPGSHYRMVADAAGRFSAAARADLRRLEGLPDPGAALRGAEARFLDLASLARESGVQLVILRPPLPPVDSILGRSPAFAAWQADFRALCDTLGVRYLDLSHPSDCRRSAGRLSYAFPDGIHLDEAGASRFTACVADFLSPPTD